MATARVALPDRPELVRLLRAATGLSREAVYLLLREKRRPRNPLIASMWDNALKQYTRGSNAG